MMNIPTPQTRFEAAYGALRDSIVDGTLAPGTHIIQEEIAARIGVSRQPIQQALALLKSQGLLVESGARGLYVAELNPSETRARFQVRAALEQVAVREASLRAVTDPDLAEAIRSEGEAILAKGERLVATEQFKEAVTEDIAFHSFLCRVSGNHLLQPTLEVHWLYIRRVMIAVVLFADRGPLVWKEHRGVLDAVCGGRAEEAAARIATHIYGSGGALATALERMSR
ncbi:MAG: GntR family transcriptional regulator [Rhodobacteraceae bacterium]|nr:GntR family transcriptional regulator [Paracoccaceae bacterium]